MNKQWQPPSQIPDHIVRPFFPHTLCDVNLREQQHWNVQDGIPLNGHLT